MPHVNLVDGLQKSDEYRVDVSLDKDNKALTIKDNVIGMTADEIRRYINQSAFPSAEGGVQKSKDLEDKSHIKLFCKQVFVSDNCAELILEFMSPLQGCLDAPNLSLNESRSYLQNEPQVRVIRDVITSRIAGKLVELDK